jgi:hypothetical protein
LKFIKQADENHSQNALYKSEATRDNDTCPNTSNKIETCAARELLGLDIHCKRIKKIKNWRRAAIFGCFIFNLKLIK